MINDFWKNPKVAEYLFYDTVGIDRIVEKYGECTNDYEIKIEYMIVDISLQLKKDIIIDITREEYDDFIEVPQRNVNRWHSIEYDDFKDVFSNNLFTEDLRLHIVPNTQSDFILLVNETFYNFNFESQAKIFFRELISYLTRCKHLLNQNDAIFQKNPIQEIVSNIYSENYLDTIQKIKNNYKLIFPEIENNFGIDLEIQETYSVYGKMNKFQELNEIKKEIDESRIWFKVGLLLAKGEIQKFILDNPNISFPKIAKHFKNESYEVYIKSTLQNYTTSNTDKNIYLHIHKMDSIIKYCNSNKIEICNDFKLKYKVQSEKQYLQ